MDDWRSKPRTGRAKITEHSTEIRILLAEGKTNRQIYNLLTNKGLDISESQFNRHIKKYFALMIKKVKVNYLILRLMRRNVIVLLIQISLCPMNGIISEFFLKS